MDLNYEDPDPPMVNTNDCGCPIPASPRRAAGCVRVQDTQFAGQAGEFPGVRRVRVIGVNKLYDIRRTYTDDMGCFQLPGSANFSGKAWFVVRFKSPRGEISRLSILRPWDLFWAMTFIATPTTIPFNDIQITFDEEDEEFRNGRGQWAAATVNNALHEYHDFAIDNNIAAPPNRLKILLGQEFCFIGCISSSSAPMFRQMSSQYNPASTVVNFMNLFLDNPLPNPVAGIIPTDAPDLFINTKPEHTSDRIKNIAFHELGHAGHYAQVGDPYWILYRRHIINNFGYSLDGAGTFVPTHSHPGIVALGEAWGYFAGDYLTDQVYGLNHSLGSPGAGIAFLESSRYISRHEALDNLFFCGGPPCDLLRDNFIPYGLVLDLIDDNSIDYAASVSEHPLVRDNISGYTIQHVFNAMRADVFNIETFKSRLLPSLPSNNTISNYNALFDDYDPD